MTMNSRTPSQARPCLRCGKPTTNKKFCSRQCSASFNYPHRRPSVSEAPETPNLADAAGPTQEHPETPANDAQAAASDTPNPHRRQWISPAGATVEAIITPVQVRQKVVFEPELFSPDLHGDTCGAMLDHLIGLVLLPAPYVRPDDVLRYASLLDNLKSFVPPPTSDAKGGTPLRVADLPLNALGPAICEWILSYCHSRAHPLMASHAFDAAAFIRSHLFGTVLKPTTGTTPGHLMPVLKDKVPRLRAGFDLLYGPDLKWTVNQNTVDLLVGFARVPAGGHVASVRSDRPLSEGTDFLFGIAGFPLLDGGQEPPVLFAVNPPSPLTYDIGADLQFIGHLLLREPAPHATKGQLDLSGHLARNAAENHWVIPMLLPVSWLRAILHYGVDGDLEQVAVPVWAPAPPTSKAQGVEPETASQKESSPPDGLSNALGGDGAQPGEPPPQVEHTGTP